MFENGSYKLFSRMNSFDIPMLSQYQIPHTSRLCDYVSMIWQAEGVHQESEAIIPQGVVDIIFNFSEAISGIKPVENSVFHAPRCFLFGMHTRVMHAQYSTRHLLLGIRLHPYQVQAMLGVHPSEIKNLTIDLSLILPEMDSLWHRLIELKTFEERVQLLEEQLPHIADDHNIRNKALSDLFLKHGVESFQSVDELSRQVCYSPRQLHRVAHDLFGLSAEELTLFKKFIQSVNLMHGDRVSLTEVAYKAGFYDQAHFCRVFKTFTGITPGLYRKRKGVLPFHIIS